MADRPNYPIPASPVYNTNIPALMDNDPASATLTFNPLLQILINNTHAIKLVVGTIIGHNISGVSHTFASLPSASNFPPGTRVMVLSDETRGGATSIYEVDDFGQWQYAGEMTGAINDLIAAHDQDLNAHVGRFDTIQEEINRIMEIITREQRVGHFIGAAYIGAAYRM